MEFYSGLEDILTTSSPKEKFDKFALFYESYKSNRIIFETNFQTKIFKTPSYSTICNITPATTMPKRSSLSTSRGKAYLIHSIAHIEYSAVDLALDHAYRFKDLPRSYYDDWLEVAEDEIRHFLMLESLLIDLGYKYGDFDVHSFLFDISQKSLDLLTRMAVVPRYLEASGLDSSPMVIEKLKRVDDEFSKKIIQALNIILKEEVDHVKKGDRWFRYACRLEEVDPQNYFAIVEEILPNATKKKHYVNVKARLDAGFSCSEIKTLGDIECD